MKLTSPLNLPDFDTPVPLRSTHCGRVVTSMRLFWLGFAIRLVPRDRPRVRVGLKGF